ncbi:tetratricopeptide repeat protein [Limibacter armeniacum]|uniref:tetratricopeptide repeat protein n=1 Tax=Limibacter armeniacum TaxID=466084 RepID=UPI002FE6121C
MKNFLTVLICTLISFGQLLAQSNLTKELNTEEQLSAYFKELDAKVFEYIYHDYDSAAHYAEELVSSAITFNKPLIEANGYNIISSIYNQKGDYIKSLEFKFKALNRYKEISYHSGRAIMHNNIGVYYFRQEQYDQAKTHYREAIALLNQYKGDSSFRSVATWEAFMSDYSLNLGEVLTVQKQYKEAREYEMEALRFAEKHDLQINKAYIYGILGQIDAAEESYPEALSMMDSAIMMFEQEGDLYAVAEYQLKKGDVLQQDGKIISAIASYEKGLELAQQVGALEWEKTANAQLAILHAARKDFEKAYYAHNAYMTAKDSLLNESTMHRLSELETKYESEKKEAQILLLEKDKEQQFYMLCAGAGFLLLVILSAAFILKANRRIRLAYWQIHEKNMEIEQQAEEITMQRDAIEEKSDLLEQQNNSIKASISYAQRIQQAMLVSLEEMQRKVNDCFVLFKPKDVVSGDFYYFTELHKEGRPLRIVAAVDCTGHGVPGAFMSLISNSLLNEIIHSKHITSPAEILTELDRSIRQTLKQSDSGNRDGMDIALCCIDEQNKVLTYAGAKNPLLYFKHGILHQVKGDRNTIGGHYMKTRPVRFTNHIISLDAPVKFYLFSDGYQDQFGGSMQKKFMLCKFKQLLEEVCDKPFMEQQQVLQETLEYWMEEGNEKQIDDILVMGLVVGA